MDFCALLPTGTPSLKIPMSKYHTFFFSPLEQFNILSLSDFTLSGGSEILLSSILLGIWSFIYITPIEFLSLINNTLGSFSIFLNFFLSFFQFIIVNLFSFFAHWLSSFLISCQFDRIFSCIDSLFDFYYSCLTYFWYVCYTNLDIFYSIDHITFLTIPSNFLFPTDVTTGGTNRATLLVSSLNIPFQLGINISLITNGFWYSFVNFYFFFLEFYVSFQVFFYNFFIQNLLNLSLSNFSYLIVSINSSTFFQILGISLISLLFLLITWKDTIVANNRWQTLLEMFYQMILNVVNENAGVKAKKFFPLIFTTFVIILTCNLIGMIPYSFTVTSHLIVTFSTALAIFTGINILGILKHGKHFLSLFFPPGAPMALAPLLVLIESISYIFRVLSLSIRLFANLMSGHTLLKILATFSWGIVSLNGLFLLPILIIFIVTGLEMAIAFLQAYIFAVLLCIYLNDAFNLH
jgi:ATP synthase subunit 6